MHAATPFVPTFDWSPIPQGVGIPPGLEVRLAVDGSGCRKARIPPRWRLQVVSTDGRHACRVDVVRDMHLAEVRRHIAELLHLDDVPLGVEALLVDDVPVAGGAAGCSAWALTVEEAQLFGCRVTFTLHTKPEPLVAAHATPDPPAVAVAVRASPGAKAFAPGAVTAASQAMHLQAAGGAAAAACGVPPPGGAARRKSLLLERRRRRTSWLPRKQAELMAKALSAQATPAKPPASLTPAVAGIGKGKGVISSAVPATTKDATTRAPPQPARAPPGQEPPVRRRRTSFVARKQAEIRAEAAAKEASMKRKLAPKQEVRRRRTSFAIRKMADIAASEVQQARDHGKDLVSLLRRAVATPMAAFP